MRGGKRARTIPWGIFVLAGAALAYKLLFLALDAGRIHDYDFSLVNWDSGTYYGPAMAVAHGGTFHSAVRTPGYPWFLAIFYRLTGDPNPISDRNLALIFVAQAALLSLGCIPLFCAIRRLTGDRRLSYLGAALWAANNSARILSHFVLTEALTASIMCLLVYLVVRCVQDDRIVWPAATGIVLFGLTLVRPSAALLAVPVAAGLLWHTSRRGKVVDGRRALTLAGLLLALPLAGPWLWSVRNGVVEGERYYCRLSSFGIYDFGVAIPIGISQGRDSHVVDRESWDEFLALLKTMPPREMDGLYHERTTAGLMQHPGVVGAYYLKSIVYLFLPSHDKLEPGHHLRNLAQLSFWRALSAGVRARYAFYVASWGFEFLSLAAMTLLIASGVRRGFSSPDRAGYWLTAVIVAIYWIAVHAVAAAMDDGGSRFMFPLVPVLIVAAAVVVWERAGGSRAAAPNAMPDSPCAVPQSS